MPRLTLPGFHRIYSGGATTGQLPCQASTGSIPVEPQLASYRARLPPDLFRWSHNWPATLPGFHRIYSGGATTGQLPCPASTGFIPVEPQLASYRARLPPDLFRWSHNWPATVPGFHRIYSGGATTGQLPCQASTGFTPVEPQLASYPARLPPDLLRWSHNWPATLPGFHRIYSGGATTGQLPCPASTGFIPVEPQLASYRARLPPDLLRWSHNWPATLPGFHRIYSGGATTGQLPCQASTGFIPVGPQLASYLVAACTHMAQSTLY